MVMLYEEHLFILLRSNLLCIGYGSYLYYPDKIE